MGWEPQQHRKFLLDYYCQRLGWSPATGLLFMYNPKTGDGRITGSAASLLGLEKGLKQKDDTVISQSVAKIIMLHGIVLAFGGIPMLYAGDEIGTLNDYSFLQVEDKKEDSRWVNRPSQDWQVIETLDKNPGPQAEIFKTLKKLISIRKNNPVFADQSPLDLYHTGNDHVLVFERKNIENDGVMVLCNFDENPQVVEPSWIKKLGYFTTGEPLDLVSGNRIETKSGLLELLPYQMLWLKKS